MAEGLGREAGSALDILASPAAGESAERRTGEGRSSLLKYFLNKNNYSGI